MHFNKITIFDIYFLSRYQIVDNFNNMLNKSSIAIPSVLLIIQLLAYLCLPSSATTCSAY